jgi:RES domain-containing protein
MLILAPSGSRLERHRRLDPRSLRQPGQEFIVALARIPIGIDTLPDDWRTNLEVTRDLGTAWLDKNETAILRVPSAIVPQTMNCLFNPAHPNAGEFRIVEAIAYPFDARLKK